jgi:hypothetical protein
MLSEAMVFLSLFYLRALLAKYDPSYGALIRFLCVVKVLFFEISPLFEPFEAVLIKEWIYGIWFSTIFSWSMFWWPK